MQALIKIFDNEIAWHGVAERGSGEKNEYYITDILVYPQEVSGASVEMDEGKYNDWIVDNKDDDRFYHINMQGHSHVEMGVCPSSTDLTHQKDILDQLKNTGFYIFMIWNKRGDKAVKIYDLGKNILFETSDIEIEILSGEINIMSFIREAKEKVRNKSYAVRQYDGVEYSGYSDWYADLDFRNTYTQKSKDKIHRKKKVNIVKKGVAKKSGSK